MTTSSTDDNHVAPRRRKLRALVISMPGSARESHIKAMFASPVLRDHFEPPVFSEGVPQRSLRNRMECLRICHQAGLIPDQEWQAIQQGHEDPDLERKDPMRFLNNCLQDVPMDYRIHHRGTKSDLQVHYSIELWRKVKTINRGRAVLACTLAHLIALKKWYNHDQDNHHFDMILEDNVRMPIHDAADRIWQARQATIEWEQQQEQQQQQPSGDTDNATGKCHLRFLGWLGSIPNLQWILQRHTNNQAFQRTHDDDNDDIVSTKYSIVPFPTTQEIIEDIEANGWEKEEAATTTDSNETHGNNRRQVPITDAVEDQQDQETTEIKVAKSHTKPGGTPVWGSYAYWMSHEGYQALLQRLQCDVGCLLWKGKRARYYHVKPADKVLPRVLMEHFGSTSGAVQLTTYPAFFRAPMLTSKIHTQYDPEFCKSTEYQLQQCGNLQWNDLWLTPQEYQVVQYRLQHETWITLGQLQQQQKQTEDGEQRLAEARDT